MSIARCFCAHLGLTPGEEVPFFLLTASGMQQSQDGGVAEECGAESLMSEVSGEGARNGEV